MRIFFTPDGSDPMLLDTKEGLHVIHHELRTFLSSSETSAAFPAATDGSPEPYAQFLCGLRVVKDAGDARLTLSSDGWLVLQGASAELEECANNFLVQQEHGHTHLYTTPVSLIIESDSIQG